MAKKLIEFIKKSPTPYHAVANVADALKTRGFTELKLNEYWKVVPGHSYYITINSSAIVAMAIGQKFGAKSGLSIVASHTDSPCLRLKPNHECVVDGYFMLRVQPYGSGIWHTWLDRDLSLAGLVILKKNNGISPVLVHIDKPLLRISELAIHLNRDVNKAMSLETEAQFTAFLSCGSECVDGISQLKTLVARELGVSAVDILDMDLQLVDFHAPCLGGVCGDFVFAPRIDNLFNVHCSLEAFLSVLISKPLDKEDNIRVLLCYDNEEVGSCSYQGAGSAVVPNILKKVVEQLQGDYLSVIANSFLLSADQAHACHPNHLNKHEDSHRVHLKKGLVIKYNANQRYATSAFSASVVKLISEKSGIAHQSFVVRNDMPCGSTIGPILSSLMGIKTADVGFPMLSMHSIREMCASCSADQASRFYEAFFHHLPEIMLSSEE